MQGKIKQQIDLSSPKYYNNREISWLAFNERVLCEATDSLNPLGERLKFLAIFNSNLDEFFMVRVAGLKDQVLANFNKPENKSGMTPKEQLSAITEKTFNLIVKQYKILNRDLLPELINKGVEILKINDLDEEQFQFVRRQFDTKIFPVLTPIALDAYRPFPMLLNKRLNLCVELFNPLMEESEGSLGKRFAIVQIPAVLERFMKVPSVKGTHQYVLLEDVISHFISRLFHGYLVLSVSQFRITRNADLTIHEEGARDLLKEIEKELKKRKWGAAVRLEVNSDIDEKLIYFLKSILDLENEDVYYINGPLDLTFLFSFHKELAKIDESLVYESLIPQPPKDLKDEPDSFAVIRRKDILLHHPYESFEPVIELVKQASEDDNVLAIKQTLYRVSGDSPIIEALKQAADNGKQVTVLVELKARFDEENNVQWAKELEKVGCNVIYGMTSLKTHSKITLIIRKENGGLTRYVHLGTGNYNDQTAKLYTDMSLLTAKQSFGEDATNFFNYLSGYADGPEFHHLFISPYHIRQKFCELIDKEISFHKIHGNGHIIAKMNALTDKQLIMKMYEASQAGVKIDLIIRGICCLKPGIPNVSETIRVTSIVGRFLEHHRIFYFHHNGEEQLYLSSADMMTRNMERRIEILFPILQSSIRQRIKTMLSLMLSDNVKARYQTSDGVYHYVLRTNDVSRSEHRPRIDSQMELYKMHYQIKDDEE